MCVFWNLGDVRHVTISFFLEQCMHKDLTPAGLGPGSSPSERLLYILEFGKRK